jgi:hypothetical protein
VPGDQQFRAEIEYKRAGRESDLASQKAFRLLSELEDHRNTLKAALTRCETCPHPEDCLDCTKE